MGVAGLVSIVGLIGIGMAQAAWPPTDVEWVECPTSTSDGSGRALSPQPQREPERSLLSFGTWAQWVGLAPPERSLQTAVASETLCGYIDVPVRWEDVQGNTISVMVRRLRNLEAQAQESTPTRHLWILVGGPGQTSEDVYDHAVLQEWLQTSPQLVIFIVDHRGIGHSNSISCPGEGVDSEGGREITLTEVPACNDYLFANEPEFLSGAFQTSEAAQDVGNLIDLLSSLEPSSSVSISVLGLSYGTYWAHNYLHYFPNQAEALILDSCLPGVGVDWIGQYDSNFDSIGRRVLAACGDDGGCSEKMGESPISSVEALLEAIDAGHCTDAGLSKREVQKYLALFLTFGGDFLELSVDFAYRLSRCSSLDAESVRDAVTTIDSITPITPSFSWLLNIYMSGSQFLPPNASNNATEAEATLDRYIYANGEKYAGGFYDRYLAATKYPTDDATFNQWPNLSGSSTEILVMSGEFDPHTPPAWSEFEYEGLKQTTDRIQYLMFEGGKHSLALDAGISGMSCSAQLALNFLLNPSDTVDSSCAEDYGVLDWSNIAEWTLDLIYSDTTPSELSSSISAANSSVSAKSAASALALGVSLMAAIGLCL